MSNRITEAQGSVEVLDSQEVLVDINDEIEEDIEEEVESNDEDEAKSDSEEELNLPEKFKGKTIADIVQSYENLEKEYGRRNNEVGELRKLTDQLLNLERSKEPTEEAEDTIIDADSLLENPQEAINKLIENNPRLKQAEAALLLAQRTKDKENFESQHPDWQDVMGSTEFLEWVGKSKVRAQMLLEADSNYDYQTGSDLINEFRELHPVSTDTDAVDTQDEETEEALKDITTEKKSKSKGSRRKIYSRAQLIDMKLRDPDGYAAREDEFMQAYAEGRVR